jgi:hypothetical protein
LSFVYITLILQEVAKKLPLTDANIEAVLSAEVRPALESDG